MPDLICTGLDGWVQTIVAAVESWLGLGSALTLCCADHDFAVPGLAGDWALIVCWASNGAGALVFAVLAAPFALLGIPIYRRINRR